MPLARFGEQEFRASDIDVDSASWPTPLQCYGCETPVSAIGSFMKETGRTSAHFRRYPGRPHGPSCVYDVHAQVTEIAEDSDGLLQRRNRLWRLVATETLRRSKPELSEPDGGRDSVTYARRTSTLLSTAARVSHVIEQFRLDGGDIAAGFAAVCNGELVSWHEFYYLPRVAWRLAHRLRDGELRHPVVVAMRVESAALARSGASFALEQPVPGPWIDVDDDRDYHVVIRSKDPKLLQPYRPGTWVLALGLWSLFPWPRGKRTDVCLWVDAPHQLAEISAPPACNTVRYR